MLSESNGKTGAGGVKSKGISRKRLVEIQSQGAGVGITGMRERIRQFKGELTIDSNPLGTTIRTTLLAKALPAMEGLQLLKL